MQTNSNTLFSTQGFPALLVNMGKFSGKPVSFFNERFYFTNEKNAAVYPCTVQDYQHTWYAEKTYPDPDE